MHRKDIEKTVLIVNVHISLVKVSTHAMIYLCFYVTTCDVV